MSFEVESDEWFVYQQADDSFTLWTTITGPFHDEQAVKDFIAECPKEGPVTVAGVNRVTKVRPVPGSV